MLFTSVPQYHPVPDLAAENLDSSSFDTSVSSNHDRKKASSTITRKSVALVIASFVVGAALAGTYRIYFARYLVSWRNLSRVETPLKRCGPTPQDAVNQGCRFELHNFAWVPPECYDEGLGDEWDSHLDWGFSRSPNNSIDTDAQFVADCRRGVVEEAWVSWYQHMAHCSLIAKKYMRSVIFNKPMDNWTSNWHHGEHCTNMLPRFDVEPFFYNSLLHLKFPTCDYSWLDVETDRDMAILGPSWHGGESTALERPA